MNEINLIKISLSLSLIGILTLFFISEQEQQPNLDRDITIKGYVKSIQQYEKNSVIKLITPETRDIIVFETGFEIKEGDFLEIRGTKQEETIFATDIFMLTSP